MRDSFCQDKNIFSQVVQFLDNLPLPTLLPKREKSKIQSKCRRIGMRVKRVVQKMFCGYNFNIRQKFPSFFFQVGDDRLLKRCCASKKRITSAPLLNSMARQSQIPIGCAPGTAICVGIKCGLPPTILIRWPSGAICRHSASVPAERRN